MVEDNKNKGDEKRKRKKPSGEYLFLNENLTEENSASLSNNKMDEPLIQHPDCLSFNMMRTELARKEWESVKNGSLEDRLAFGALYADEKLVDQCIRFQANVNYVCPKRQVPIIFLAADCKAYFVIKRLLECDDLNLLVKDPNGMSPSEVTAMGEPNSDLTEMLLQAEMQQAERDEVSFTDFLSGRLSSMEP